MGRKSRIKDEDILGAIEYWDNKRGPLTVDRLAIFMHTSKTNMHYHLRCLREAGLVDWMENTPGTLHVTRPPAPTPAPGSAPAAPELSARHLVHIPLIAEIPAGEMADAPGENGVSYHPDWVSLDLAWLKKGSARNLFALKVVGDSMKNAQIHTGDVVIIQPVCCPQNGDIVAANVEGKVTLKYYFADRGVVTLRPANTEHPVRSYPIEKVKIEGKAIFVICPEGKSDPEYGRM